MKTSRAREVLLATFVCCLLATTARAHIVEGVGDFYAGMLHPVTTLESLLPTLALALLAGQQGRTAALLAIGVFPAVLAASACAAQHMPSSSWAAAVNLASIPVLGVLVVVDRPMHPAVTAALAGGTAVTQGVANGEEITAAISAWRFIPGLALAGLLVVVLGVGLVRSLEKPWMRVAVRVAGSWIAAIGVMALAFAL